MGKKRQNNSNQPQNKQGKDALSKPGVYYPLIGIIVMLGIIFTNHLKDSEDEIKNQSNTQSTNVVQSPVATNEIAIGTLTTNTVNISTNEIVYTEEMVPDMITQGDRYLNTGQLSKALDMYQTILKFDPDMESYYFNYAIALQRKGDDSKAEEMYLKAIDIWPEYSEALNNLANMYVNDNKISEAIPMFEKAIEYFPDDYPKGYNNLGKAYARNGDLSKAVSHFSKAVEMKPDFFNARINLGTALFQQDRYKEASEQFQFALKIKPNNKIALQRLEMVIPHLSNQ